jgi:crotonobetainyl-CoA:carnitine CoA-transferase CaiB-like acyl-CoA transferase
VLTSSDWCADVPAVLRDELNAVPIVCDVTAFGSTGPLAGERYTDAMMQAFAGLMDTTGSAEGEPVVTRVRITECTAAVFAAAAVVACVRARRTSGASQRAEVAMFDTAVSMLSTFLPKHFVGESPQRMGNRHPSMAPWNAYPARDGWLLLCSASNDMWGRVCDAVGRPEVKDDPRFRTMAARVEHVAEADAAIEPWIASHSVVECLRAFNAASVPCGPVYDLSAVLADENVRARGAVAAITDAASGTNVLVPGGLIHGAPAQARAPSETVRPARPAQRRGKPAVNDRHLSSSRPNDPLLAGIRVLEMGSYTTAPLAARNLGAMGADVVKLEPPSGELSRASPPYRDGQSYFCTLSNSDKRCVAVDLRAEEGRVLFTTLLAKADVFVENMKPGVLGRFGFGAQEIAAVNPRLVYCSVSGYGASSPLADLPAMDTTIQGMAGIMDLTRSDGVPFKTGISISDILGGQFALLAILAGLEYRDRTGKGQVLDLSMQELSVWLTQLEWNGTSPPASPGRVVRCADGFVYVTQASREVELSHDYGAMTREEAATELRSQGLRCAPINSVSEVATHPQTLARELIVERPAKNGNLWPLLASPIRLSPSPLCVRRAIGGVGEDLHEVLRDWSIAQEAVRP